MWGRKQASVLVLDREASRWRLAGRRDDKEWGFFLENRLSLTCNIHNQVLSERTMSTVFWDL